MLRIINSAAQRYQGVIPSDCWHEPYMSAEELEGAIEHGVEFWVAEVEGALLGVMGVPFTIESPPELRDRARTAGEALLHGAA